MAETKMPAAEAAVAVHDDERNSYEFAFHVLPTVAEGEVASVFESLKELVSKNKGEIFDEESPERIDLAYDIVKYVEGKNRSFHSSYFGWIRFHMQSADVEAFLESVEGRSDVLRHLLIKLTKEEEAMPFRFHEARKERKIETIEEKEVLTEANTEKTDEPVSDEKLDESLERITDDTDVDPEKTDTIEDTDEAKA